MIRLAEMVLVQPHGEAAANHCTKLSGVRPRRSLNTIIKALDREIARVKMDVQGFVRINHAEVTALLDCDEGFGTITIIALRNEVPEFGKLTGRDVSALMWVAPINRDFGCNCIFAMNEGRAVKLFVRGMPCLR